MIRIAAFVLAVVNADIPIHCKSTDFTEVWNGQPTEYAEWTLHRTKAVPLGQALKHPKTGETIVPSSMHGPEKYCGLGSPNKNPENVAFLESGGIEGLLDGMELESFRYKLTQERVLRGPAPHRQQLVATCVDDACKRLHPTAEGKDHTWTPAFDEGWNLQMSDGHKETGYMSLAEYRCDPSSPGAECGKIGQGEKATGAVPEGYSSICGRTLVGWYDTVLDSGEIGRGCFYAMKDDFASRETRHSAVIADTTVKVNDPHASFLEMHTVYRADDFEKKEHSNTDSLNFQLMTYQDFMSHHNHAEETHHKYHVQHRSGTVRRYHSKTTLSLKDACDANNEIYADLNDKYPKVFDWANHFGGQWRNPVADQGACGSCYGVAMLSSLESRANLHLFNALKAAGVPEAEWPTKAPVKLSVQAHMSCNHFDQGCQGGYPFNSAKWVALNGVPTERLVPSANSTHGQVGQCQSNWFSNDKEVLYAQRSNGKDGQGAPQYVSGSYGSTCSQHNIMHNVMTNGPIMAALEVTPEFSRGQGIVGESFLQMGRGAFNNGPQVPSNHHTTLTTEGAALLEARYAIKHPDSSPQTKGCPQKLADPKTLGETPGQFSSWADVVSDKFDSIMVASKDQEGWYTMHDQNTFFLNTKKMPSDMNPYLATREKIAEAYSTDPDCVHLEIASVADDGGEYTNHAIIIRGWGEEKVHDHSSFAEGSVEARTHTRPYWIVQNSWGEGYGNGGTSFVARSVDYAGLEHQGVDVRVDGEKGMMKAMLDQYKKKYPHIKYVDLVPGKEEAPRMDYESLSEGYDGNAVPLPFSAVEKQAVDANAKPEPQNYGDKLKSDYRKMAEEEQQVLAGLFPMSAFVEQSGVEEGSVVKSLGNPLLARAKYMANVEAYSTGASGNLPSPVIT